MRIIQPSVAKRIAFATWARKNGVNRRSSVTYAVADDITVPEGLMVGAQVDGKMVEAKRPTTRKRKTVDRGPVEEPAVPVEPAPEGGFRFNPVDYPQQAEPESVPDPTTPEE